MNLGKSLKVALAMKGMKNKELAEKLGVNRRQVTNWICTGSIRKDTQIKICEIFEMKASEFVALGED
jgi:DNA-binding Xre family transcriptional regulator